MPWTVPGQIKLTMVHHVESTVELRVLRTLARETSSVVRRPDHGELRVTVRCGHCGREGVFAVQDLETTRRLRRGPVIRSSAAAAVLLTATVALWVVGFARESALFLVLAFVASLILGPIGIALALDPSRNIGVEVPDMVPTDATDTTGSARRRKALACMGRARPA